MSESKWSRGISDQSPTGCRLHKKEYHGKETEEIRSVSMAEPDKTTIGDRLRYIRGSLTQPEFGEKLGVGRNNVYTWESNKNTPSAETLLLIYKEYGVNINWLLSGEGKPYLKRVKYPLDIETRIIKMESRITILEKKAKK